MPRPLNILVVDDEPTNREVAEVILVGEGHAVTCAENGQEALDLVERQRFDLVLMDILMPVMSGLEAIQRLRANAETRQLPIMCVSAKASGSNEKQGFEAGCDYYLKKPYKRKELLEALQTLLAEKGITG